MTISRTNPGGWAAYETLTSAQMNQLDINMTYALDGNAGGDYSPSSDLKVYGKILGESVASRDFHYPLSLGKPETDGDWELNFTLSQIRWISDSGAASRKIIFSLNRFLQTSLLVRSISAYVYQDSTETGADRMKMEFFRVADGGTVVSIDLSYFPELSGDGYNTLYCAKGFHDGGDGQSSLTDSLKSWQTNWFVGNTIYNITDGSSGIITANTATGITATLSGGTDNDWDDDDEYRINMDTSLETDTYDYYIMITSPTSTGSHGLRTLNIEYIETDYLIVP